MGEQGRGCVLRKEEKKKQNLEDGLADDVAQHDRGDQVVVAAVPAREENRSREKHRRETRRG